MMTDEMGVEVTGVERLADVLPIDPRQAGERLVAAARRGRQRHADLPPPVTVEPAEPDGETGAPPRVPARYATPLDQLDQTGPVRRARAWDPDQGRGLLLAGPVGRGKSVIAGALAAAAGAPYRAHYWPVSALLEEIKAEMGRHDVTPVLARVASRLLLVLDDVGAERPTEWSRDVLSRLVADRYDADGLLVVTTNLPPARLAEHVGERAYSRLCEMCELVTVDGPDRRRTT